MIKVADYYILIDGQKFNPKDYEEEYAIGLDDFYISDDHCSASLVEDNPEDIFFPRKILEKLNENINKLKQYGANSFTLYANYGYIGQCNTEFTIELLSLLVNTGTDIPTR